MSGRCGELHSCCFLCPSNTQHSQSDRCDPRSELQRAESQATPTLERDISLVKHEIKYLVSKVQQTSSSSFDHFFFFSRLLSFASFAAACLLLLLMSWSKEKSVSWPFFFLCLLRWESLVECLERATSERSRIALNITKWLRAMFIATSWPIVDSPLVLDCWSCVLLLFSIYFSRFSFDFGFLRKASCSCANHRRCRSWVLASVLKHTTTTWDARRSKSRTI